MKQKNLAFLGLIFVILSGIAIFQISEKVSAETPFFEGELIKSPSHSSVYYVYQGKRHPFVNETVYKTWYKDFTNVNNLSVSAVESLELGEPMPLQPHTKLVKFPNNPKVYVVFKKDVGPIGATLRHIPSEAAAMKFYGSQWSTNIVELPEIYWLFYSKGKELPVEDFSKYSSVEECVVNNEVVYKYINYSKPEDDIDIYDASDKFICTLQMNWAVLDIDPNTSLLDTSCENKPYEILKTTGNNTCKKVF